MTALQTRFSSKAVLNSQDIFRLTQEIESSGDIFFLDTSAQAMTIGPQSDLSSYNIDYYAAQAPNRIDRFTLEVRNPIAGRIDALMAQQYPGTQLPGQMVLTARDIVDNTFLPTNFNAGNGDFVADRPQPMLDVVSHLSTPVVIAPERDDKTFFYPAISQSKGVLSGNQFYILPYYGRRYGHITLRNLHPEPATTYTINVRGINLSFGGIFPAPSTQSRASETVLVGNTVIASGGTFDLIFTKNQGLFDLICIELFANAPDFDPNSTLRVTFSDREQ